MMKHIFLIALLSFKANLYACEVGPNIQVTIYDEIQFSPKDCDYIGQRISKYQDIFKYSKKTQQQNQEKYYLSDQIITIQIQQLRIHNQVYGQLMIGKFAKNTK